MKHRCFLLAILFLLFVFTLGQESRADVGDTRETATDLALGKPLTETVDKATTPVEITNIGTVKFDIDYFRIVVAQSGKLTVWTTRNVDTEGELEDSSGTKIAENSDSGRKNNFKIIRNIEPGTYYLKVRPYPGYKGKKYTVRATLEPGNYVLDVGDTPETATDLALDTPYTDELILSGNPGDVLYDKDYFRIVVAQSGKLTVWTTGGIDTYAELQNSSGTFITENDDDGRGDNFKIIHSVEPGTYFLKVGGWEEFYELTYTVHATLKEEEVVLDGGTRETAIPLALDTPHTETFDVASGDFDYFRIEVDRSAQLTVWATGNLDTVGELQDSSGTFITEDDDDGPGDNFKIIRNIEPGTYYLKVTEYDGNIGTYTVQARLDAIEVVVDAGRTRETAIPLALDTPHTETFKFDAEDEDIDYYRIEVDRSAQLTVWTTGDLDTVGELQDNSGATIAKNDDDNEDNDNFKIIHNVEPGTYYMKVTEHYAETGTYTVHATLGAGEVIVETGGRERATPLALDTPHTETFEVDDDDNEDIDYFRIEVDRSAQLTVWTTGDLDTVGELQNSSGTKIAENDDDGPRR